MLSKIRNPFVLLLAFSGIYIVYAPGLSGGFWLDDYGSLPDLFESIDASGYWEGVFGGYTGPLGRPLSLLTFAWQHSSWPKPHDFILFNVLLHIVNAGLIFALCLKLLPLAFKEYDLSDRHRFVLALCIALVWALSPLLVSTVLYVVQRMVLLSSFFVLLACLCFCWGYRLLELQRAKSAIAVYIIGCGVFGILGMLAKESAFLLVVYLLAIKYLYDQSASIGHWFYRLVIPLCLWSACLIFLVYIVIKLQGQFADTYEVRGFDLPQRLLTESRIVWLYIKQLFFPQASYLGLFHDDYPISTSIVNPISTLWSILSWSLVLLVAVIAYIKGARAVYFGVLWFIGGHVLESTVVPLELYFEHRNYLPSLGLWFAAAVYVKKLNANVASGFIRIVLVSGIALYGLFLASMSFYISSLWGKPAELSVIYAAERKDSLRARALMVDLYQQAGSVELSYEYLGGIVRDFPGELAPRLIQVQFSCVYGEQYQDSLDADLLDFASRAEFSHGTLLALVGLIDGDLWQGQCKYYNNKDLVRLIGVLLKNPMYSKKKFMLQGFVSKVYQKQGDLALALEWLRKSPSTGYDNDLLEVVFLASLGRHEESLRLLKVVKKDRLPPYISTKRRLYLHELEQTIVQDLERETKIDVPEVK